MYVSQMKRLTGCIVVLGATILKHFITNSHLVKNTDNARCIHGTERAHECRGAGRCKTRECLGNIAMMNSR